MAGFEEIYHTHSKPVYRFLLTLTGSETQAEELLQETFFQALIHIDRFEGRSSLYTWLCQIAKNAWLKECRRSRRFSEESLEALALPSPNPSPESDLIRTEDIDRIRRAVYHLEEPYKEVFILHTFGELKLTDIAQAHGKSESWARVTYYRAKQKIIQEVSK